MNKVYTIGYSGRSQEELLQIVRDNNAVLVDIRFSANSRSPQWAGWALKRALGDRYMHVKALGNENYKNGGPIKIVDYAAAKNLLEAQTTPVILMCGCPDYHTCHRRVVAEMLQADGIQTEEIKASPKRKDDTPGDTSQPRLF